MVRKNTALTQLHYLLWQHSKTDRPYHNLMHCPDLISAAVLVVLLFIISLATRMVNTFILNLIGFVIDDLWM